MRVLAAAPTPEAVGLALVTLHQDERDAGQPGLRALGTVGVLDVCANGPDGPGEWIVVPFPRKDH